MLLSYYFAMFVHQKSKYKERRVSENVLLNHHKGSRYLLSMTFLRKARLHTPKQTDAPCIWIVPLDCPLSNVNTFFILCRGMCSPQGTCFPLQAWPL